MVKIDLDVKKLNRAVVNENYTETNVVSLHKDIGLAEIHQIIQKNPVDVTTEDMYTILEVIRILSGEALTQEAHKKGNFSHKNSITFNGLPEEQQKILKEAVLFKHQRAIDTTAQSVITHMTNSRNPTSVDYDTRSKFGMQYSDTYNIFNGGCQHEIWDYVSDMVNELIMIGRVDLAKEYLSSFALSSFIRGNRNNLDLGDQDKLVKVLEYTKHEDVTIDSEKKSIKFKDKVTHNHKTINPQIHNFSCLGFLTTSLLSDNDFSKQISPENYSTSEYSGAIKIQKSPTFITKTGASYTLGKGVSIGVLSSEYLSVYRGKIIEMFRNVFQHTDPEFQKNVFIPLIMYYTQESDFVEFVRSMTRHGADSSMLLGQASSDDIETLKKAAEKSAAELELKKQQVQQEADAETKKKLAEELRNEELKNEELKKLVQSTEPASETKDYPNPNSEVLLFEGLEASVNRDIQPIADGEDFELAIKATDAQAKIASDIQKIIQAFLAAKAQMQGLVDEALEILTGYTAKGIKDSCEALGQLTEKCKTATESWKTPLKITLDGFYTSDFEIPEDYINSKLAGINLDDDTITKYNFSSIVSNLLTKLTHAHDNVKEACYKHTVAQLDTSSDITALIYNFNANSDFLTNSIKVVEFPTDVDFSEIIGDIVLHQSYAA